MPDTKYKQLQDEAELLGIKQNQSTEKLVDAIAEATSPEAVALLIIEIAGLSEINMKLGEAKEARPSDLEAVIERMIECHDAQLADRNVHTDVYLTGLANGLLVGMGIAQGEEVTERLLKPITQTNVGGAKVMTGRQRLLKEAGKYITNAGGGQWRLRSGLTDDQKAEADEIMERLGVTKGTYSIPAE